MQALSSGLCLVHSYAVDSCCTGVTTVCDMGSIGDSEEVWEALEQVYMAAADKGELPIRIFAMVPLSTWYRCRPSYALPCKQH